MKQTEAALLKKGDLVMYNRASKYEGFIFEVESIEPDDWNRFYYATLKQPGFNDSFRMEKCDTRLLKKYES